MQAFRKVSTGNGLTGRGSLIRLHSVASTAFVSQIALREFASDTKVLQSACSAVDLEDCACKLLYMADECRKLVKRKLTGPQTVSRLLLGQ